MMKVLYDISILGLGHRKERARTGIFRVIENLALELSIQSECDISFCATGHPLRLMHVLDYLNNNKELSRIPLIKSENKLDSHKSYYNKYLSFEKKIEKAPEQFKTPLKIIRELLSYTNLINTLKYKSFPDECLDDFDIFHSPFEAMPNVIKKKKGLKAFLTVYDLIPILFPHLFSFNEVAKVGKALKSLTSDSWVLCISNSTKNDLCNFLPSLDPQKISVTPLAASDTFYFCDNSVILENVRSKYSIPNAPYILSLSTLEPRKNIAYTIRCFLTLIQQENISDLNLVLTGAKGWNYDSIFAEINSASSLRDRIILTGYVPDEDLAPLYSDALAFVYPSLYEGFGLPPLEAMQCGVPVITSNTSSLPEVVGEAGLLLDPKDTDGLCQGILDLYDQPNLRKKMSEKSLRQAQKFSWRNCASQTINAYKSATI